MANSVDLDQTASTLFASILNLSVMLGNYFRYIFFLGALRVNFIILY